MGENTFKIVILGSSAVGKTSLIRTLLGQKFIEPGQPTIGVDFKSHTMNINDETVTLQIWDTAGQERFRSISRGYFRNALGALLVFDISNRKSFDDLNQWLSDLTNLAASNAVIILIGNKADLSETRTIEQNEGEQFAQRYGLQYIECSARDGSNVEESFARLAGEVLRCVKSGAIKPPAPEVNQLDPPRNSKNDGCNC